MTSIDVKKRSTFFQAELKRNSREPEPFNSLAIDDKSPGSGSTVVRPPQLENGRTAADTPQNLGVQSSEAVNINMFSSFGPAAWEKETNFPKISFRKFPATPGKLVSQTSLVKDSSKGREDAWPPSNSSPEPPKEPIPPGAFQISDVQTFTLLNTLHAYDPLTYRRVFRWISGDLANNFVNSLKKSLSWIPPAMNRADCTSIRFLRCSIGLLSLLWMRDRGPGLSRATFGTHSSEAQSPRRGPRVGFQVSKKSTNLSSAPQYPLPQEH